MTDPRRASDEHNPFAPPPEGAQERPWEPRGTAGGRDGEERSGGSWDPRPPGREEGDGSDSDRGRAPGGGLRWDPTDPKQRQARYALLAGTWGLLPILFGWLWASMLLGALGIYWGVEALRKPKPAGAETGTRTPAAPAPRGNRPQTAIAVAGIVMAALTLSLVTTSYALRFAYQDYFHCVEDALTSASRDACEKHLPEDLRPYLGQ